MDPNFQVKSYKSKGIEVLPPAVGEADFQFIKEWIGLHQSRHTRAAYAADAWRFMACLRLPLAEITTADLLKFMELLATEDLKPATRARMISSIKSLFAYAHRKGYIPADIGRDIRPEALKDRLAERILPESDILHMIRIAPGGHRNRVLLMLLYATGARVSEICGLRWRDTSATTLVTGEEAGQVTLFGKGGKTRAVPLPPSVWKKLMSLSSPQQHPDDPVFVSRKAKRFRLREVCEKCNGKAGGFFWENGATVVCNACGFRQSRLVPASEPQPLTSQAVLRIVQAAARKAGIEAKVSPHWFRHAHASHALDRGAPIHLVQATLGHANVNTTGRYLHARPSDGSSRFLPL